MKALTNCLVNSLRHSVSLTAAVVVLTALSAPGAMAAAAVYDVKTYHGSECQYIDVASKATVGDDYEYNNPLKYDTHGVINVDAATTHVVCPVVRDNAVNSNGTLGAKVFVNNVANQDLWCNLISRDHYGGLIAQNVQTTTAGGNRTLSLDVNASAAITM